jgi:hypothetical protein
MARDPGLRIGLSLHEEGLKGKFSWSKQQVDQKQHTCDMHSGVLGYKMLAKWKAGIDAGRRGE